MVVLNIRATNDIELVTALHRRLFPADEIELGDRQWIIWKAGETRNLPVGFCAARLLPCIGTIFLLRAGVNANCRGRHIQRRCISVREAYGRRHGYKWMMTYVLQYNHSSLANLIKTGYEIYEPEYAWAGRKEVFYLRKKL